MFADGHHESSVFSGCTTRLRLGLYTFAAGSIAAGIFDLIWGDFEAAHQPIQSLGDHIPGRQTLAYIAGLWLIAGGGAILWRRTARFGAMALLGIYLIFAGFWLPRFYTAPRALGFRVPLIVGLLVGVAQQLILAQGAAIILSRVETGLAWLKRSKSLSRWVFGLSSIDFGLAHVTGIPEVAQMVPAWMPFGGEFWAVLTGIAFIAAGAAILSGVLDVLAARLLALMLFVFSLLVLAPGAAAHPQNHIVLGSNAYNLAAVGAVWIFAESLAVHNTRELSRVSAAA